MEDPKRFGKGKFLITCKGRGIVLPPASHQQQEMLGQQINALFFLGNFINLEFYISPN